MEGSGRPPRRRLPTLGQVLSEPLGDVAALLRLLPEIASLLRTIAGSVKHMDEEVTGMHAAVVRLEAEIIELRLEIGELEDRMSSVAGAITRLEPHIVDVNLAVRPFRRARARLRPADAQPGEAPEAGADRELDSEAEPRLDAAAGESSAGA